jgi:hypothetical protein
LVAAAGALEEVETVHWQRQREGDEMRSTWLTCIAWVALSVGCAALKKEKEE